MASRCSRRRKKSAFGCVANRFEIPKRPADNFFNKRCRSARAGVKARRASADGVLSPDVRAADARDRMFAVAVASKWTIAPGRHPDMDKAYSQTGPYIPSTDAAFRN